MKEITITLNDFLFNSGIIGFLKILQARNKNDMVRIEENTIHVNTEVFDNFEEDYIEGMLYYFEKETRWYRLTSATKIEMIQKLQLEKEEDRKKLEEQIKEVKQAIESNSYKAGFEIIKEQQVSENPQEYLQQIKKEKDVATKREYLIKILEHLKKYKNIYCMKDIIYNKINVFWENVAFLNRQKNKNDIQEEYKRTFVEPVHTYLEKTPKAEYTCIECGNYIGKSDARGMAFLKDVGVDEIRKTSAFWNFCPDALICPICSLIYSCIPLGFTMIGSNAIFINNNESVEMLQNINITEYVQQENEGLQQLYNRIVSICIADFQATKEMRKYEPSNIQVIKRVGSKDTQQYAINIIAKDKINIIKKAEKYLETLIKQSRVYQQVVDAILAGENQYRLLSQIFQEGHCENARDILMIQIISKGGTLMKEAEKLANQMIDIGEDMQKYFWIANENKNKLKSYSYKFQRALKSNNINDFKKLFVSLYGSLGKSIPTNEAVKVIFQTTNEEVFKELGYAYIYGLEKIATKKEEGGKEDEE